MDLICCESEDEITTAYVDPVIIDDFRVFENLRVIEERYVLQSNYFKCVQLDLKPFMRTIVSEWMQEVCEEEHCQDEVFPLAVNLLDRFLMCVRIDKSQLQLLGAVCLFLASKLRQSRPLTAERLCVYSDNSFTVTQLCDWELFVLKMLKWDLSAVTPFDFVSHILRKLDVGRHEKQVRQHVSTFIGLCTTELTFSTKNPSVIAAASIAAAVQGLSVSNKMQWATANDLLYSLSEITDIDMDDLRSCWLEIEEYLLKRIASAALPITASVAIPLTVATSHKLAEQQISDISTEKLY